MYDISTKNVKKGIGFFLIFLIAGVFFLIVLSYAFYETFRSGSQEYFLIIFLAIPIIFIIVAVVNINKINQRLKVIQELNVKGKLVKNIPYHLENTGMSVNNVQIQRPVVEYTLPSGTTIILYGDPRHDRRMADADGMVDLVIDEGNPNNYFIDFEINRLSGNLPNDYYYIPQSDGSFVSPQNVQTNLNGYPINNFNQPNQPQFYPNMTNVNPVGTQQANQFQQTPQNYANSAYSNQQVFTPNGNDFVQNTNNQNNNV